MVSVAKQITRRTTYYPGKLGAATAHPKLRAGFKEPPVKYTPVIQLTYFPRSIRRRRLCSAHEPGISATNSASPIPTGAMKVSRDFSTARISTTKTRYDVKNISAKTPCATLTPGASIVFNDPMSPGKRTFTTAPAQMHPISCEGTKIAVLSQGRRPARDNPKVT